MMFDSKSIMPLFLSFLAGLSTIIGAFIVFFTKADNNKLITFALSFSAGVMISISLTDLFPSAQATLIKHQGKMYGIFFSLIFLVIGSILALLIDSLTITEKTSNNSMYKIGFVTMLTMFLHNLPEGIATYVSGYNNISLGIYIALAISLHNIPEGISVAMPIYYSTKKRFNAFKFTFISGMAEPLGAFLAFLFLKPYINDLILSISFALVTGIMLFISFYELIPEARKSGYNKIYLFSLLLGICIIPISHNIL